MYKKILMTFAMCHSVAYAEHLNDALKSTYENNSKLLAKLYDHFAVQEHIAVARGAFLPSINAQASADMGRSTGYDKNNNPKTPTQKDRIKKAETGDHAVGLSVTQNLFRSFGDVASVSVAESEIQAHYYDYVNTEQEILLSAVNAFANVIFCQKSLQFHSDNEAFLSKQLEAVKLAKEVGEKTSVDVSQAMAAMAEAKAKHIQAKGELSNARANYSNIIGHHPQDLSYPGALPKIPNTLEQCLEIAQTQNPQILQAKHSLRQAQQSIHVKRADMLPSLDAEGSVSKNFKRSNDARMNTTASSISKNRQDSGSIALKLSVPIYNRGADWSNLRQTNHKAMEVRLQLQQAIKDTIEETTKAWEGWITAKESIALRQAQVDFSKKSRDGAFLAYEVGEASYLDSLDAQNKLLAAQEGLEEARKNELVQYYKILALVGKLTHKGIDLDVKPYQVQEHYNQVRNKLIGTRTEASHKIAQKIKG